MYRMKEDLRYLIGFRKVMHILIKPTHIEHFIRFSMGDVFSITGTDHTLKPQAKKNNFNYKSMLNYKVSKF